jgi:hypothetical protein
MFREVKATPNKINIEHCIISLKKQMNIESRINHKNKALCINIRIYKYKYIVPI